MDSPISQLPAVGNVTQSDLIPIVQAGVTSQASAAQMLDLLYYGITNARNSKFAGGMKGDGTTDDTAAWNALLASGAKHAYLPSGRYVLNKANVSNLTNTGLSNMVIEGDGPSTVLFVYSRNLCFNSPSHVTFRNLRFEGNPTLTDTGSIGSVWCSNYTDITFDGVEFDKFGGSTTYQDSTVCLYLYAGPNSAVSASGNSSGALVTRCRFYAGGDRLTNFGVRVFTEWASGASLAYANTGAIITDSTFTGFNWNAVELTGPMTSSVLVSNCVANACGLTPFDIDKGANNCRIENITINRLLGNIDTTAGPTMPAGTANTRVAVVSTAGESNVGRIAIGNHVDGVVANLLASDIAAFGGNGGYCAAAMSMAKNCIITNIEVNVDSVPAKNAAAQFALAAICIESHSGCRIENITTTNATAGIVETAQQNASVGSNWTKIKGIRNIGTMKAEPILIAKGSTNAFKLKLEDIKLETDFTAGITDVVSINLQAGTASGAVVSLDKVYISTPGYTVINPSVPNLAINNVYVDFAANSNHVNFFTTGNNCAVLNYTGAYFNGKPLDVSVAFARLLAGISVRSTYLPDVAGALPAYGGIPIYSTAAPTNPAAANWATPTIIYNLAPAASGPMGWIATGTAFKAMANLAA